MVAVGEGFVFSEGEVKVFVLDVGLLGCGSKVADCSEKGVGSETGWEREGEVFVEEDVVEPRG